MLSEGLPTVWELCQYDCYICTRERENRPFVPAYVSLPHLHFHIYISAHLQKQTMSTAPVFKIVPGLQSYAWGKKGSSSLAAQLGSRSIPDLSIDDEKPYAEVCPLRCCHYI